MGGKFLRVGNAERILGMSVFLGTKLRKKLLAHSFNNPDESYYVRELSGLIKEDPGNLSRELRKLEEEGLYNSITRGNVKFYSLNKSYPLFREVKKIVLNSTDGKKRAKAGSAINNSRKLKSKH
ncbi:MAG: winged helix-turn-helix domain-containing protein [Thermodesulfobacteriota bacterium]